MTIDKRLKEERARAGLTQDEMSKIGGVGLTTQKNYEKGLSRPDADYLSAISHIIDVGYIINGQRSDFSVEVREANSDGKPDAKSFNPKLGLKAAEMLELYKKDYNINEGNRVAVYEMIYVALCLKEYTGQITNLESMLELIGGGKTKNDPTSGHF